MLRGRTLRNTPVVPKTIAISKAPVLALAAALALPILAGCEEEATGRCCTALAEEAKDDIPQPDIPEGEVPRDVLGDNPRFDCDTEFCVSRLGSEAFCTRMCNDSDCPDGFECTTVLESADCDYDGRTETTDDDCPLGTPTPLDKFCVRKQCSSAADCPGSFDCVVVHAGGGTEANPEIKQCVKKAHTCEEVNK